MPKHKNNFPHLHMNLLHSQGLPEKLPLRFLRWLLHYGRFIVVLVEIVVLASFTYRFKLDADLATLKQKIDSEVPYIQSQAQDEALIKQTQIRLTTIKKAYSIYPVWGTTLKRISDQVPGNVRLTGLNLDHQGDILQFRILAQSSTNNDLAIFMNSLKNDKNFSNINLTSISFDQGNIVFTISGSQK